MCTITYIPHQGGYILTQNRDESPLRADAVFPIEDSVSGVQVIYPQDPEGSGSWFVSAKQGMTLCVMNGVFHANKKEGQFKHSRGLVPLHYLAFESAHDFIQNYHYRQLEGFVLLVCTIEGVEELFWDESKMHHRTHEASAQIFQSPPLYNSKQQEIRKNLFQDFSRSNESEQILDFHTLKQIEDPEIDILMDRGVVKSVSTIQRRFFQNTNEVGYLKRNAEEMILASFK